MKRAIEEMETLTFGTEIELVGITRDLAAKAIQSVVGGQVVATGGSYDAVEVRATDGRVWKAVRDGSLSGTRNAEVVTPILRASDMDALQAVVRALRAAGAKADGSCGMHVHVGSNGFTPENLANMVRIFYKQEELILKAVGTWENRMDYTRPTDREFINRLEARKPKTMDALNTAWFGRTAPFRPSHYDSHRYRAMNLNNLWGDKGTIEFRFFNSTTHAGEVKANIFLCLAVALLAKNAKAATSKHQRAYGVDTARYDTRVFLLRLGLIGPEYKTVRTHLLKRLSGSSAWRGHRG